MPVIVIPKEQVPQGPTRCLRRELGRAERALRAARKVTDLERNMAQAADYAAVCAARARREAAVAAARERAVRARIAVRAARAARVEYMASFIRVGDWSMATHAELGVALRLWRGVPRYPAWYTHARREQQRRREAARVRYAARAFGEAP